MIADLDTVCAAATRHEEMLAGPSRFFVDSDRFIPHNRGNIWRDTVYSFICSRMARTFRTQYSFIHKFTRY